MREVEFLPAWYVEQRGRAEQRSAQFRVCAAAVVSGLCMSAAVGTVRLSQAVASSGAPGAIVSPRANRGSAGFESPRGVTRLTARALDTLDQLTPSGLVVSHLDVRSDPGEGMTPLAARVEVRGIAGSADLIESFVGAVRSHPAFAAVEVRNDDAAGPTVGTRFCLSLQLRPAGQD